MHFSLRHIANVGLCKTSHFRKSGQRHGAEQTACGLVDQELFRTDLFCPLDCALCGPSNKHAAKQPFSEKSKSKPVALNAIFI